MKNTCTDKIANMQQLQQNQDGTLKGGYISITDGRYRIIIGPHKPTPNYVPNNPSCGGSGSVNTACTNGDCAGSTNHIGTQACANGCCIIIENNNLVTP